MVVASVFQMWYSSPGEGVTHDGLAAHSGRGGGGGGIASCCNPRFDMETGPSADRCGPLNFKHFT